MTNEQIRTQVLVAPRVFEERHFQRPSLGENDGLMAVAATGLCGSDLASFQGEKDHGGPVVLGHEVIGRVAELGSAAAQRWGVRPGDRIAVEEAIPCLNCELCRSGQQYLCPLGPERFGYTPITQSPSLWGGFADLMYLPPNAQIHRVPEAIPDDAATLFIPLSNGLAWMHESAEVRPGDNVVVFGPGQHGIAAAAAALRIGARCVVVVGTSGDGDRLKIARSLGCQTIISGGERCDDAILDTLSGYADVVLDMTPYAAGPLEMSLRIAGMRARVVWGGMKRGRSTPNLNTDLVAQKELTIRGVWARPSWAITAAFAWLETDPDIWKLCERSYELSELPQAFAEALGESDIERPLHSAILTGSPT